MKKLSGRTGVGASSILLILVVLCLTVFSVLALLSARVDKKLCDRTYDGVQAYYAADAEAQKRLVTVDSALRDGIAPEEIQGVRVYAQGDGSYRFTVRVDSERVLETVFVLPQDGAEASWRYRVVSYRLLNMSQWEEETLMPRDAEEGTEGLPFS